MPVVGTAGHVDHGKSTLILRLTGRDPDRWDEEKRRGLTIDLGFAWMELGGREISFVDVPGHERFVKNMLAGIEAVDAAILVVAADEGWMPQTEEHAAVLDLLGLSRVVVAITKADRVEDTTLIREATRSRLEGLAFEGARMIDVSGVAGTGMDELTDAIEELVTDLPANGPAIPHVWVDRSFSITGAGTVITGTLQGGSLTTNDSVTLQVGGQEARIRGIQTHERQVDQIAARQRVAVNLGGMSVPDVPRGTLLTVDEPWRETQRLLVGIRPARYSQLDERGAFQLHLGTGVWSTRLRIIDDQTASLHLDRPVPAVFGAPFILRDSGRRLVVAGGTVLDPAPPRRRAHLLSEAAALLAAANPDDAAAALLDSRGAETAHRLSQDTGGGRVDGAVVIGDRLHAPDALANLQQRGAAELTRFHDSFPLRDGMQLASLGESLGLDSAATDGLAQYAGWTRHGSVVALPSHGSQLSPADEHEWERIQAALAKDLRVPRLKELAASLELLAALINRGSVIRVSDELVFLPAHIETIRTGLAELSAPFTVSEFRQHFDLSRKYAVPLLEWTDRKGWTHRRGDVRTVRLQPEGE